ncbi:HPP family protein [Streptomyces lasalocidi]
MTPHRAPRADRCGRRTGTRGRLAAGGRLFLLSSVLLCGVGALGPLVGWVTLTTTLGPTAYLLLHTDHAAARLRNALLGHASAVASGLACLAAFGLWDHPSAVSRGHNTVRQIVAQSLAVGLTVLFLELFDAHHPPAAATALLITSGITRPGPPLYGMLTGLALVLALTPVLARTLCQPLHERNEED